MKFEDFADHQSFLFRFESVPDEKEKFAGEKVDKLFQFFTRMRNKVLTFCLEGNGIFLASFHLDHSSMDQVSIPDTAIQFYHQQQHETCIGFLKVRLAKIHHLPNAAEASTFEQMGSLSHQIALCFYDLGDPTFELVYMLNPNQIKFKVPLHHSAQTQIPIHPFDINRKETWPYLNLSYEPHPHKSYIALRLYPLMGDHGMTSWDKGVDSINLLRIELTDWLSSLTDPSLLINPFLLRQSPIPTKKNCHEELLERSISIIEKMHHQLLSYLAKDVTLVEPLSLYKKNFIDLSQSVSELDHLEKENKYKSKYDAISFGLSESNEGGLERCQHACSLDEFNRMIREEVELVLANCI